MRVVTERTDRAVVLRVAGEVDVSTTPELRRHLDAIDPRAEQAVVDLTAVDLLDSAALGALVGLRHRAQGRAVGLLCREGSSPRRLLRLTGLENAFTVGPDLDALLARMEKAGAG